MQEKEWIMKRGEEKKERHEENCKEKGEESA